MPNRSEVLSPSFHRTLGPRIDALPFATAVDAEASLSPRTVRQLAMFRKKLAESGLDDNPAFAAVRAVEALFPGSTILLHPGAYPIAPAWTLHNFRGYPGMQGFPGARNMHEARCYQARNVDPFANFPVALPSLLSTMHSNVERAENMVQLIWANDTYHQLRMVIYQGAGVSLYVGIYWRQNAAPFGIEDHALLLAARPELTQWIETCRLVGLRPIGEGTIGDLTEAMTEPMVLILRDRIVHASPRARALLSTPGSTSNLMETICAQPTTYIRVQGEPAKLVRVVANRGEQKPLREKMQALPPSLLMVAEYLAQGLGDKDIVERTGHSLATVRTYVTRVFARLGIHDRRELMRGVRADDVNI